MFWIDLNYFRFLSFDFYVFHFVLFFLYFVFYLLSPPFILSFASQTPSLWYIAPWRSMTSAIFLPLSPASNFPFPGQSPTEPTTVFRFSYISFSTRWGFWFSLYARYIYTKYIHWSRQRDDLNIYLVSSTFDHFKSILKFW